MAPVPIAETAQWGAAHSASLRVRSGSCRLRIVARYTYLVHVLDDKSHGGGRLNPPASSLSSFHLRAISRFTPQTALFEVVVTSRRSRIVFICLSAAVIIEAWTELCSCAG